MIMVDWHRQLKRVIPSVLVFDVGDSIMMKWNKDCTNLEFREKLNEEKEGIDKFIDQGVYQVKWQHG